MHLVDRISGGVVERERCFPEVLDGDTGGLFVSPVLVAEDSMLWAANLWHLLRGAGASAPALVDSGSTSTAASEPPWPTSS
jgi:hypothetical protein